MAIRHVPSLFVLCTFGSCNMPKVRGCSPRTAGIHSGKSQDYSYYVRLTRLTALMPIALMPIQVHLLGSLYTVCIPERSDYCCSYDCYNKQKSLTDIVERAVSQILEKLNAFTLFEDQSQCILRITEWLTHVVCNVGISTSKNVQKRL